MNENLGAKILRFRLIFIQISPQISSPFGILIQTHPFSNHLLTIFYNYPKKLKTATIFITACMTFPLMFW